jgi:hypothetical protein
MGAARSRGNAGADSKTAVVLTATADGAEEFEGFGAGVGVAQMTGDREGTDAFDEGQSGVALDVGDGRAEEAAEQPSLSASRFQIRGWRSSAASGRGWS